MTLEAEDAEPFSSLDDYTSGLVVDRDFLVSLERPAQRQAFVLALAKLSWEGLEDLSLTLGELFSADLNWFWDVQELFVHEPVLWRHLPNWGTDFLASMALSFPESSYTSPAIRAFLEEIERLLELRGDAFLCPDVQRFAGRMAVLRSLESH